jgi:hypothetical protein
MKQTQLNELTNFIQRMLKVQLILSIIFLFAQQSFAQNDYDELWNITSKAIPGPGAGENYIQAKSSKFLIVDFSQLQNYLSTFPSEESVKNNSASPVVMTLINPKGEKEDFLVMESSIMAPELAQRYPEIKTFIGQGISDPVATIRFDITPAGFHAQILSANGAWYIDPVYMRQTNLYITYYKKDYIDPLERTMECLLIEDEEISNQIAELIRLGFADRAGEQLRTYRTAIAATGEYTAYHGGTVQLGLAAVVTALNRVNGVYEKEVAVRMVLIANNDLIIYTNGSTDPYTNNNGSTMLGQNITNLNSVIGSANYDIGHVFSTGGGGVAYLGSVCGSSKAGGVTGSPSPIGDPFTIDYVAHEMGHQYGGNHSFNGSAGSCSGGNRNASTAYEPGSGTTIMAYAGICSPQNIQNNSDAYFHGVNLDEIIAFTTGSGNSCAVVTQTGNNAPVVQVPTGGFSIPISTPFKLTGSATDANGDALTYCWEEFDLGVAGAPNSPSGNAPIFRSFTPVTSPTRLFPRLANILNNTQVMGEILPTYARTLTFRLTARDNKAAGGGTGKAQFAFSVVATAGPFVVTYPNTNISIQGNSSQTITWNVANTNVAPVNVANVNILLSTDGGQTFPITIAANTPNDGTEEVAIPNEATTSARIMIEAVGNVFFDLSNANFTIIDNPIPVELASFNAVSDENGVVITWSTVTETNNSGFNVERSSNGQSFEKVTFVEGNGTTTEKKYYRFVDNTPIGGRNYYRLSQVDFDGTINKSNIVEVDVELPLTYSLEQNHPNPFNPSTTINYQLAKDGFVTLKIYNVIGREVAVLVNQVKPAGKHTVEFNSTNNLSSGTYFYELRSGDFVSTKKLMLMK